MSDIGIDSVLSQIRSASLKITDANNLQPNAPAPSVDFGSALKSAINKVDDIGKTSSELQAQFEAGDKNVSLADVMIATEKASISFEALTQVRNKLVTAYQEIMSMPV